MSGFTAVLQARTCLYLILGGVCAGLFYDALIPLRRYPVARAAADALFALFSAALAFLALVLGNADAARPYVALTFFLGIMFWRLGPRRWARAFFRARGRKRRAYVEKQK